MADIRDRRRKPLFIPGKKVFVVGAGAGSFIDI
jgi:hypothetical protein